MTVHSVQQVWRNRTREEVVYFAWKRWCEVIIAHICRFMSIFHVWFFSLWFFSCLLAYVSL